MVGPDDAFVVLRLASVAGNLDILGREIGHLAGEHVSHRLKCRELLAF